VKALNGICELFPKLSKYENPPHIDNDKIPKYSVFTNNVRNIFVLSFISSKNIEMSL
jgi:hypothetical protein